MLKTVVNRLIWAVPLFVIVTFGVFFMVGLAPVDPAQRLAGEFATPAQVEALRQEFSLDRPLLQRYVDWLTSLIQGDLGISYAARQPVTEMIFSRYSITLSLGVLSLVLSLCFAIPIGIAAALKPRGLLDRGSTALASMGLALPSFWVALMLVILFSARLGWLPAIGYEPWSEGFFTWLRYLILPALALAIVTSAETTLQLKAAMIEALGSDYVLAAEAKGLPTRTIIAKHAFKNAAIPVVTVLGFRVAQMLGGAVIIENVFAMDGLGSLAVRGAQTGDLPVVIGLTAVTVAFVVLISLIVDMSYLYLDPRTRK